MDNTDSGRSPSGSGYSAEPGPISVVPAVPVSIPNAVDALATLIAAVEFEAQRVASESEDAHVRECGRILLACANEAKPSLIYPHQRAAMAIRDALGRGDEDWRLFVPAAFAALASCPAQSEGAGA